MIKLRFLQSQGSPLDPGTVIRAGAKVEMPEFWAKKFIAQGIAEAVEEAAETVVKAAVSKAAEKAVDLVTGRRRKKK